MFENKDEIEKVILFAVDIGDGENVEQNLDELEELASAYGVSKLHDMLKAVDPDSAAAIHENNVKRVIRALEFYKKTGKQISKHNEEERARTSPYNFAYFVLNNSRDVLYNRIDIRVDIMLENGLVDEVKALMDQGYTRDMVSMQGLGYKEIIDYLSGDISYDEAVYILKRDTRHFAKRQITWFKRERDVIWVNKNEFADDNAILSYMDDVLLTRQIIR